MKIRALPITIILLCIGLSSFAAQDSEKEVTNQYCVFDLYGSWGDFATSAEAICSSGLSFNTGDHFALRSKAEENLKKAERALLSESYMVVENFELHLNTAIYWHNFRLFKKKDNTSSKDICLVNSKKQILIGCTQNIKISENLSSSIFSDTVEKKLKDNGFVQSSLIEGKNLYKNNSIKVFER